jgi:peptidyl-prolyl cis-trans isomerase B (cyclophilin B)
MIFAPRRLVSAPGALAALAACSLAFAACTGAGASGSAIRSAGLSASSSPAPSVVTTAAPSGGPSGGSIPCPTSVPPAMASTGTATVTIRVAQGDITIKVEGTLGPRAAGNFVALAQCGYFDGVEFHRLVPGFVIQGGDGQFGRTPSIDLAHVGQGGPGYSFADDPVTVPYTRGTVAMANSGPNTNGSQFFIVLADAGLPPQYSVFGHVTTGMDVVDAIAALPNKGAPGNQPLAPVPMTKVTVTIP